MRRVWDLLTGQRYFLLLSSLAPYLATELSFLAAIALFLVGVLMEWHPRTEPLAVIVQRFSIVGGLLNLHLLTHLRGFSDNRFAVFGLVSNAWAAAILIAATVLITLGFLVLYFGRGRLSRGTVWSGQVMLYIVFVLVMASLYASTIGASRTALGIAYSVFYYLGLLWLIYVGYLRGDAFRVNAGFAFFVLGLVYLYFNSFWTMMSRSFFFIGGGLLICAGGYVLEVLRRRLVARLRQAHAPGDPA